ncbi:MAG TPA: hypothetical protein VH327_03730 [Gammaproteobacteria bacterium]|nr:hypothetical protein [Gammaproteobacteria bacterium]
MQRILAGLIFVLALMPATGAGAATDPDSFILSAEQWALPRSGDTLIRLAPVRAAMADWLATPGARILIRYSGSDAANLWAGELQDWLVALGLPADRIEKHVSADLAEDAVVLKVQG